MNEYDRLYRQAQRYREMYPEGTRILLLHMGADPRPVEDDMRGTVKYVDDRRFDRRRKATTWWQCSECKASVNMSDENMLNGITELLNEVIADPESIQIPKSDHEESQEIKRLNTEISKALNTIGFDKEAIKQKMLTCVSEKYTSLGTEEITAQSLKDIFKTVPPLTAYDSDLTDQAVSEIQLKRNGTISLVLINGQRIGKEKSA